MKRAVRIDKIRLAAIEATLRLYRDPDPSCRKTADAASFVRAPKRISARRRNGSQVARCRGWPELQRRVWLPAQARSDQARLPRETIASAGLYDHTAEAAWQRTWRFPRLAAPFRKLDMPMMGRIEDECVGVRSALPRPLHDERDISRQSMRV